MTNQMPPQRHQELRNVRAEELLVRCLICPPAPTPTDWAAAQFAFQLVDMNEITEPILFKGLMFG